MIDPTSEQGEHMWQQLGADLMQTLKEYQIVLNLSGEDREKANKTADDWEREKALTVRMIAEAPARFQSALLTKEYKAKL